MVVVVVVEVATVERDLPFTDGRTTLHRRRLAHLLTMTTVIQIPTLLLPLTELDSPTLGRSMKSHVAFSRKKQIKSRSSLSRLEASGGLGA
jgi:hypothetical protein